MVKDINAAGNVHRIGKITLILGPMFSGKSTELMRLYKKKCISLSKISPGENALMIRKKGSDRYGIGGMRTHDFAYLKDGEYFCEIEKLSEVSEKASHVEHIFIDEAQFFKGLKEQCVIWSNEGRNVTIAGLSGHGDHPDHTHWEEISRIIPFSHEITNKLAVCELCGNEATLTMNSDNVSSIIEAIGGKERYYPCCIRCSTQKKILKL